MVDTSDGSSAPAHRIGMNDFRRRPESEVVEELNAIERVVRSGWYVLGTEVESFERLWADRCGVRHAIGVGNGLDAIEVGLRAVGIGPGDEVITTAMTAYATILGIQRAGATPVIADIEPGTGLLDIDSARRCISERTRAVMPVHLYGQACDVDRWSAFARANGVHLVEDCAQAHGACWNGRVVGSYGIFGAFSFYPTKNLAAFGDGGSLVTDDDAVATAARSIRNYGQTDRYTHEASGMNSRLDELQAAVLAVRTFRLAEHNRRRSAVAAAYRNAIRNGSIRFLEPPAVPERHVYHLFVVRCPERDRLARHFADHGITTLIHYPVPAHRQPIARGIRCDPGGLVAAETHAKSCLSLPCHPHMDEADVQRVIAVANAFA